MVLCFVFSEDHTNFTSNFYSFLMIHIQCFPFNWHISLSFIHVATVPATNLTRAIPKTLCQNEGKKNTESHFDVDISMWSICDSSKDATVFWCYIDIVNSQWLINRHFIGLRAFHYIQFNSIRNLHIFLANHFNHVNHSNIMTCCTRIDLLADIFQQTFSLFKYFVNKTQSWAKIIKAFHTNFLRRCSFVHRIGFRASSHFVRSTDKYDKCVNHSDMNSHHCVPSIPRCLRHTFHRSHYTSDEHGTIFSELPSANATI